jgi:hypothetical protein
MGLTLQFNLYFLFSVTKIVKHPSASLNPVINQGFNFIDCKVDNENLLICLEWYLIG